MLVVHMLVHLPALLERRQTHPADVRLAARAGDVVAARDALDGDLARRAALDIARARPLLEEPAVLGLAPRARRPVVALDVAPGADADEAGGALQDGVGRRRAVHLRAVRGGAIEELVWSRVDICEERRADDVGELFRMEDFPGDMYGDE